MLTIPEKIEDQIARPADYKIVDIKVLKAWNEIPINDQVGPTCGIYGLDAALQIQGKSFAPRRNAGRGHRSAYPGEVSLLKGAKLEGLSQVGEIGKAEDLAKLATAFGVTVEVKRFGSEDDLWSIIQKAFAANRALVLPYSCLGDDGAPAWSRSSNGFAHWCLLFGYVEFTYSVRHIFMTTYGRYHEVSTYQLFKSNQRIQDWPRQTWVKVILWVKDPGPGKDWRIWKKDWRNKANLLEGLKGSAKGTGPGWGFGIGDDKNVVHKFVDPPNPINLDFSEQKLAQLVRKTVELGEVKYTETLCGQCVVV
jgi:hypothetical protein